MSVISRLLGSPDSAGTVPGEPAAAPPETPSPDPAAVARDEEAAVAQAIADRDSGAVARWVLEGSSTRIRQMAAHAITDPEQMRELIRATRGGNDKHVYRILTAKRDALLAELRGAEQLRADVDSVAAAIGRHAVLPYDPLYADTLGQLEARWQTLAPHAAEELQAEVARHLARAREVVSGHQQAVEAEAQRKRAAALAADEARHRREAEAEAAAAAAAEQARSVEAERLAAQAQQAADEAAVGKLVGLLRQTQAALTQGATARAARLRETIGERLPQAPPLPPWFARHLEQIDTRLEELKDWKTFTVVPKRAELLRRMQALVGAEVSPEELAGRVRRLRDEWRTLHRGAGEDPTGPEEQQFEAAAERAYEPCREHFARQAALRKQNQERREELIVRLTAVAADHAGENPDWRTVSRAIVDARREWREHAPVDQSVVKGLQERFHAVIGDLQGRLDAEFRRNVGAKRELISRAAALLALTDTRAAIEEAKSLQKAWKAVGIVPRQQDNTLWEAFRKHCNAVFERSAQEAAAHGSALAANEAQAVGLCVELERIAALDGEVLRAAVGQRDEIRARFDALELPRASARQLRQRFSQASARCDDALRRERAAAARRGWNDLFAAAARVSDYALALGEARPAIECEALREAAAASLAALVHAPKAGRAILERRLAQVPAGSAAADLGANEAALRLLCIRAELAADKPTPPEDLTLRREYQMQRLVETMGRGERAAAPDLDALALEWLAVGPVRAAATETLLARFERCRDGR